MTKPKTLVLPAKPSTTLSARLPGWRRAQVLQKYVIDVYDALVRACRDQVGAVLPEPAVIAAHFEAFTVEQAKVFSLMLHARYGATLPSSGGLVVAPRVALSSFGIKYRRSLARRHHGAGRVETEWRRR